MIINTKLIDICSYYKYTFTQFLFFKSWKERLLSHISIFSGAFGSGKTEIALNYALERAGNTDYNKVLLADLDTANPFFVARDARGVGRRKDTYSGSSKRNGPGRCTQPASSAHGTFESG